VQTAQALRELFERLAFFVPEFVVELARQPVIGTVVNDQRHLVEQRAQPRRKALKRLFQQTVESLTLVRRHSAQRMLGGSTHRTAMDIAQRIAQFENMASADPSNEMAHFSLAGAYAQAGRLEEAAERYLRTAEINPDVTKAYQLAADCLLKAGQKDRAADVATRGFQAAASRGDRIPMDAMARLLRGLGKPVPQAPGAARPAASDAPEGGFVCAKSGRPGKQMTRPPFRGPVGQWIQEHIAEETFNEWIAQGTKVINELRLDLSRDEHAEVYDRYMREYLGLDDETYARISPKK